MQQCGAADGDDHDNQRESGGKCAGRSVVKYCAGSIGGQSGSRFQSFKRSGKNCAAVRCFDFD